MKPTSYRSMILLLLLSASGCASVSSDSCFAADWYERGVAARQDGLSVSEMLNAQNDCAHFGVVPDYTAFVEGWYSVDSSGV